MFSSTLKIGAQADLLQRQAHPVLPRDPDRVLGRHPGATDGHLATISIHQTDDDLHQGALTGTVVTNDPHDLTGCDLEIHALQCLGCLEGLCDPPNVENWDRWLCWFFNSLGCGWHAG